jgi:hypothetical protein
LISGYAFSNAGVSFCISIMWPLFTVGDDQFGRGVGEAGTREREHQARLQKTLHVMSPCGRRRGDRRARILETLACGIGTREADFDTWMHRLLSDFPNFGK